MKPIVRLGAGVLAMTAILLSVFVIDQSFFPDPPSSPQIAGVEAINTASPFPTFVPSPTLLRYIKAAKLTPVLTPTPTPTPTPTVTPQMDVPTYQYQPIPTWTPPPYVAPSPLPPIHVQYDPPTPHCGSPAGCAAQPPNPSVPFGFGNY